MNETTEFSPFPGSHRLADLARRVPRAVWPFIVLAAAQILLLTGPGILGGGGGYLDLRIVAILVIPTLLPVAVIIGRRDAWNSARVIMIGAILWGSVGALVQVFGLGQFRFAPITEPTRLWTSASGSPTRLASLIANSAPALIAFGLRRRRRTETSWPRALVAVAVLVTAALCVYDANQALQSQSLEHNLGYYIDISLRDQLDVLAQAMAPLGLLALGALAWSTLSAFRANETPRPFWFAVSTGSTLVLAAALYSQWQSLMPTVLLSVIWSATYQVQILAILAGLVLLLIGFGVGLPDSDEDLLGRGNPRRKRPSAVLPKQMAPDA